MRTFIGSASGILLSIRCVAPFIWISLFGFSRSIPTKLNSIVPLNNIAVMVSEASPQALHSEPSA
jgi:hypothetical protein